MKKYFYSIILAFFVLAGLHTSTSLQAQEIMRKVDIMPEYPGGQNALSQFISNNIKWPTVNSETNTKEGTVYVTFVVEKDGSISQIKALKGIGSDFEKEAENVVKKMPKWSPGKQENQPVRVMLSLPIEFKLTK